MKILHIYKDYAPVVGGIENHVRLVAERQVGDGHDVTVLVTSPTMRTERSTMNGVRLIKAGRMATIASTPISLALCRQVALQRPDITHLHFPYPVGETANLLFGHGPYVVTYHSDVVRQERLLRIYRPIMNQVLARAARIIATSPRYVETSPVLSQMADKCSVVPLSIDGTRFRSPHPYAQALREAWADKPTVLFVGVLRYYKGLTYLLKALRDIDAHLAVVGSGPLARELQMLAHNLEIDDRVTFCGRVSDELLPAYYQAADVFCLPACERSEAFGIVQLEALAAGCPIVSTELGTGTSYVNRDGVSGLVVPPRNAPALAEALNQLLLDDELRRRMSRGSAARADQFSIDIMMHRIYDVYHQAL